MQTRDAVQNQMEEQKQMDQRTAERIAKALERIAHALERQNGISMDDRQPTYDPDGKPETEREYVEGEIWVDRPE